MADEFFDNFSQQVAGPVPAAACRNRRPSRSRRRPAESLLQNKFVWAAVAIVVLMILVLLFR